MVTDKAKLQMRRTRVSARQHVRCRQSPLPLGMSACRGGNAVVAVVVLNHCCCRHTVLEQHATLLERDEKDNGEGALAHHGGDNPLVGRHGALSAQSWVCSPSRRHRVSRSRLEHP
jgi:hypothetical protein